MKLGKFKWYKKIPTLVIVLALMASCGSSKNATVSKKTPNKSIKSDNKNELRKLHSYYDGKTTNAIRRLLKDAEKYLGSPYKFGGNDSSGFDCSGFTVKVFKENNFSLPRRSSDQAESGESINIEKVRPGDLLFFATSGATRVSHVGIVHTIEDDGEVKFIHASTTKGVIISSLNSTYWNKAFLHAKRVL